MWFTTKFSRPRETMGVIKHLSPKSSVFLVVSGWQVCDVTFVGDVHGLAFLWVEVHEPV